jgi:hypothetical protein
MDGEPLQEILTKRNKRMLDDGGYLFTFHKCNVAGDVKFWRCRDRNNGCKSRLHTDSNDVIIGRLGVHTHGSNAAGVEVERVKTSMKRKAQETMEKPSQIVNNCIKDIDQATMGQMPNKDAARKIIQRNILSFSVFFLSRSVLVIMHVSFVSMVGPK